MSVLRTEKERIEQNLFLVLDMKPPLPEPSLTGKNERASVGQAAKLVDGPTGKTWVPSINVPTLSVIDIVPCNAADLEGWGTDGDGTEAKEQDQAVLSN